MVKLNNIAFDYLLLVSQDNLWLRCSFYCYQREDGIYSFAVSNSPLCLWNPRKFLQLCSNQQAGYKPSLELSPSSQMDLHVLYQCWNVPANIPFTFHFKTISKADSLLCVTLSAPIHSTHLRLNSTTCFWMKIGLVICLPTVWYVKIVLFTCLEFLKYKD